MVIRGASPETPIYSPSLDYINLLNIFQILEDFFSLNFAFYYVVILKILN